MTEEYYSKFGETYFINETVRRIRYLNDDKVAITGIRAPIDVTTLRKRARRFAFGGSALEKSAMFILDS